MNPVTLVLSLSPLMRLEPQASRHSMALRAVRTRHFVLSYSP